MRMHREAGYTLLSLLAGLAILSLCLSLALHHAQHWRDMRLVHGTSSALAHLIQQGMTHSVMTRQSLLLCTTTANERCTTQWQERLTLRASPEAPPLATLSLPASLTLYGPRHLLYFQPVAFDHQTSATFTVCGQTAATQLVINRTGRIRHEEVDVQRCRVQT